jgi:hypothetical protein
MGMIYSPKTHGCGIGPEGWLVLIKRQFGEDYLTKEQERILLEDGIQALLEVLPDKVPE